VFKEVESLKKENEDKEYVHLAVKFTFLGQLSPNFGFPVQMDALRDI
jgi:hypothetical protein